LNFEENTSFIANYYDLGSADFFEKENFFSTTHSSPGGTADFARALNNFAPGGLRLDSLRAFVENDD